MCLPVYTEKQVFLLTSDIKNSWQVCATDAKIWYLALNTDANTRKEDQWLPPDDVCRFGRTNLPAMLGEVKHVCGDDAPAPQMLRDDPKQTPDPG